MTYKTKLIEVALPLEDINREASFRSDQRLSIRIDWRLSGVDRPFSL